MMQQQQLFEQIYKKGPLNSDNVAMLQKEALNYPYFSLTHYFLLKETEKDNSQYKTVAGKAAIHFNNPLLLNYKLHQSATGKPSKQKIQTSESVIVNKPADDNTLIQSQASEPVKDEMLFEPLFTTDYFASQGIKLSEEVKPDDKLGKQLKSFTEWLKTMKKNKAAQPSESTAIVDISVEKMAENSNKETEVVTESMAEVFIQQGKSKKAIEIYEKLSLLNPAKSTYFAAKIESLKEK